MLNLVDANLGIAIVPHSMRGIAPAGVCFIDLPEQLAQSTVGLMYRRDPTPLLAGFIAAFEAGLLRLN